MLRLLTLAAVLSGPEWGTLVVPSTFRPAPDLPLLGTSAAAPASTESPGRVLALFVEAEARDAGVDPPLVAVSVVPTALPEDGSLRDSVFSSTVDHFHLHLDLEAHVDRPVIRGGHVEVSAEVSRHRSAEMVRLGFYPSVGRHFVVWASYPTVRSAELTPVLDALFDSFRPPGGLPAGPKTSGLWKLSAIAGMGVALAFAARVRGRRRSPPWSADRSGGSKPKLPMDGA